MLRRLKLISLKIIFYIIGYTPLPILHFVGALLGTLLYVVPTKLRYHAKRNLELCFPELSLKKREYLLWQALKETGKGFLEAPVFWVRSPQRLLKLVHNHQAFNLVQEGMQQERGAIVLGLHLGGYYLKNSFMSHYLPNTTYLYKPQKGVLGELMEGLLHKFGGNLVTTSREGVLSLFRHLKKGGCVGMICDHNVLDQGSVWASYFGRLVPTTTLPGKLAHKTDAPVYLALMERLNFGRGYRFHAWQLPPEIYSTDETIAATTMNQAVETAVRRFPAQHEWLYRRFWDRPDGEPSLYKTQRGYVKPQ